MRRGYTLRCLYTANIKRVVSTKKHGASCDREIDYETVLLLAYFADISIIQLNCLRARILYFCSDAGALPSSVGLEFCPEI